VNIGLSPDWLLLCGGLNIALNGSSYITKFLSHFSAISLFHVVHSGYTITNYTLINALAALVEVS